MIGWGKGSMARLPIPASAAVDFSSSASIVSGSANDARRGRGEGSLEFVACWIVGGGSRERAARTGRVISWSI